MKYLEFISKHNKLYNINQEYTTSIDQFLFENYYDFIMTFEIKDEEIQLENIVENTITIDIDKLNKQHKLEINNLTNNYNKLNEQHTLEIDNLTNNYNKLNEQHKLEIDNLTNTYESIINQFKKSHEQDIKNIQIKHENEINKIKTDTNELLTKNLELKFVNEINDLKLEHANEINELQKQIFDLKSTSSIKLGNKAEQDLKELFIKLGKHCVDMSKTSHVADLWIIDEQNKILYVIESKNKGKISSDDLTKFKFDLDYINKNFKTNDYKTYEIIGLFVSTRGDIINQEIGSFSFGLYETYISQQYISEEFFKLYFKSVETLIKLKSVDSNYNDTLNLINGEYKNLRCLIDMCDNINKNANIIIENSNTIKKEISIRVEDFKNKLTELNSPDSKKLEIEEQIKKYIRTNKKFTCTKVREMSKGYNIFNGKQLTKKMLIDWALV